MSSKSLQMEIMTENAAFPCCSKPCYLLSKVDSLLRVCFFQKELKIYYDIQGNISGYMWSCILIEYGGMQWQGIVNTCLDVNREKIILRSG